MNDVAYAMFIDETSNKGGITGMTLDEGGSLADLRADTRREIVQHDDSLAAIEQRQSHVTADIAGPAGNQDRRSAHQSASYIK
jgi:hypothetical protein